MNTDSKPYTIKIIWGASPKSVENDAFKGYSFATIEELIAFVKVVARQLDTQTSQLLTLLHL